MIKPCTVAESENFFFFSQGRCWAGIGIGIGIGFLSKTAESRPARSDETRFEFKFRAKPRFQRGGPITAGHKEWS